MSHQDPHAAPARSAPSGAPSLDLGVVVPHRSADRLRDVLTTDLPGLLAARFPGVHWRVEVVVDRPDADPVGYLDALEAGRDRLLDADWDLAVLLTDLPLKDGRDTVLSRVSPVHGVGLVSTPALGALHVRSRVGRAVVGVVATLLGAGDAGDHAADEAGDDPARGGATSTPREPDEALLRRVRQLSSDTESRADDNPVEFAGRVLGGNLRVLLGMVRANRPWRLALGLSRALTGAVATATLALVTSDLWLLAAAYGPGRLLLLSVLSVAAVSTTLVLGARLWERPRRRRDREPVLLFNVATAVTVATGVVVLYLGLAVLAALGAVLLVDAAVFADVVGVPLDGWGLARLAWLTASLATVGGALGAGLESDDAVREAAYTRPRTADRVTAP